MSAQSKGTSNANANPTILERIYAQRAKDVEVAKSTPGTTPEDISNLLAMNLSPPLIPLVARLKRNPSSTTSSPSPSLMAEIKRASPSKGPIAMTTNAAQQAQTYALSGASVISVLTEPTWFKGSLFDMRLVRQAIDALPDRPAILRKDFILDEYQIAEARLHGADTVLLIVAMLSQERLQALYAYSLSLGMEPLVEVNNASEMSRALALDAKVIGVNNRNLHDFNVDMGTTSRLVEMVRQRDVVLCALSGISSAKDVKIYKEEGVRAVLVGEALMRAQDTAAFIRDLLDWPEQTLERHDKARQTPWVKVTGVTSVGDAVSLIEAGADMLGLVFDPEDKNWITPEVTAKISAAIHASRAPPATENHPTVPHISTPWFTTNVQNLTSISPRPLIVGIFRDQPLSFIRYAVAVAQLDLVQLNGIEPAGWVQHIPVPVIRKFGVEKKDENIAKEMTRPGVHAFSLLDLRKDDDTMAEWQVARKVVEDGEIPKWPMPIILGGGLTPENVAEAVRIVAPWAVDIQQETDAKKVEAFINAAKCV